MNILLIAKLSDNSLNCILEPLLKVKDVDHIYVLRDTIGNINSEKITYITDTSVNSKNKIRHLVKLKKGVEICKNNKIDFVIGVLLYPHGYLGRIISLLVGLPYIHVTIAGHREFWVKGKFVERFNLFFFKKSHKITVTGHNTRKYLISKGIDPQRVTIMQNVIKMDKFNDYGRKREIDIVTLSRLDRNKNVSLLLKAIVKIDNLLKVKVLIAGDGPEYKNLVREVKELNIEKNVKFLGWVEQQEINDIYNSAKIFVLCSKGEGFPLSLLEAMACGCVPVVTDVGDISDVVINGENGYLISNNNDENELASILELLIKNQDKIKYLSTKANGVKTNYSFENIVKIWDLILKK